MENNTAEPIATPVAETSEVATVPPVGIPKKSLALIAVLAVVTIVLIVTAVIILPRSKAPVVVKATTPVAKKVVIKANKQTVLGFSAPVITAGAASTANINITTGVNKITAVQLEMSFDPKVITNVSITPGTFFSDPVSLFKEIDPVKGTISYAFGIGLGQKPVTGTGTLATVSFTVVPGQTSPASINFLPTTMVAAQGEIISALKSSTGLTLTTK